MQSARKSFGGRVFEELKSFVILEGMIVRNMFEPKRSAVSLPQSHIQGTQLICDRTALLAHMPRNGVVAEVGVDEGSFSAQILEHCQPTKLYLMDAWGSRRYSQNKMKAVQERFKAQIQSGQVEIIRGDSVEVLSSLPNDHLDWVYIDTTHEYERTSRELKVAETKVKAEGLIAGHDYTIGNMNKLLRYGVISAVNEFCVEHQWNLKYLTNEPGRYLSFVLERVSTKR